MVYRYESERLPALVVYAVGIVGATALLSMKQYAAYGKSIASCSCKRRLFSVHGLGCSLELRNRK
jgi:hypothetical protein